MRKSQILSGWKNTADRAGGQNTALPLDMPFGDAPATLTLEREIAVPEDEKNSAFYLETRCLSGRCTVYVDGEKAAVFRSVFAPCVTALNDFIKKGAPQTLRLEIEPEARPDGRFTFGGARLISTRQSHFALSDACDPIRVRTVFTTDGVRVLLHAEIENPNNYDVVLFRLCSPEGILLDVKSARPTAADAVFELPAPLLWEGVHAAYNYRAEVILQRDTEIIDLTEVKFGIRRFEPSEDGFFTLNGIKLPLNGAFLKGAGTPAELNCLRSLDANLVGLTALDLKEELLNLCDEQGVMVFFMFPDTGDDRDFEELARLTRLLAAHPSVAFIGYRSQDPSYGKKFCNTVKENSQFIYTAGGCDILNGEALSDAVPDVLFLKYTVSADKNGFTELQSRFEEVLEAHLNYRFAVFPDAPACSFGKHTENPSQPDGSQEYFSGWHARVWEIFSKQKRVVCYFTGALSDGLADDDLTGLTTLGCAACKDAFWFYKTRFSAEAFIKLASLPSKVTQKSISVKCYTNAKKLTLAVNGKTKKRWQPVQLSDGVYLFPDIRLKHRENTVTVSGDTGEDRGTVFRARKKLFH